MGLADVLAAAAIAKQVASAKKLTFSLRVLKT
jgi:hypothetical protein